MNDGVDDMERKLLEILGSEDVEGSAGLDEALQAVENAFPDLDEGAQKAMARVMLCDMPTPEEIERAERTEQHNAVVRANRAERLAQRARRRELGIKPSRKRRKD